MLQRCCRTQVNSPAQLSGLKDPALLQLWHRSKLRFRSNFWPRKSICLREEKERKEAEGRGPEGRGKEGKKGNGEREMRKRRDREMKMGVSDPLEADKYAHASGWVGLG